MTRSFSAKGSICRIVFIILLKTIEYCCGKHFTNKIVFYRSKTVKTKATSVHKSGLGGVEGVMVHTLVYGMVPHGQTMLKYPKVMQLCNVSITGSFH